ncbi:MAG: hypothetical protein II680_04815 [Clostridia bacterium]|nr:hypothetical protein [Clostridia bacterium]
MTHLKPETTALLEDIERRIDPETEEKLDARWLRFLNGEWEEDIFRPWRDKDRLTPPGTEIRGVNINDALADFDAMIVSEMNGVSRTLGGGGSNLAVRTNYGSAILATLFGAEIFEMPRHTNTLPTVRSFNSTDRIREMIEAGAPDLCTGFGARVFACGEIFREIGEAYPKIGRYVSVYHPDLQGPLDICELLWGEEMFYAMYDEPELVHAALSLITQTYIRFMDKWFGLFPCGAEMNVHWSHIRHKGRIALRCDSAMNLSPELYKEFAVPYDRILLERFGGGMMHFCGRVVP